MDGSVGLMFKMRILDRTTNDKKLPKATIVHVHKG